MEEIKQFRVGSRVFSSKEEAEKFEEEERREKEIVQYNHNLLGKFDCKYVPVVYADELDISYNCDDQYHYPYKLIIRDMNVRYCDEKIKIIKDWEWLDRFVAEKMNHIISCDNLEILIKAPREFNREKYVDSFDILTSVAELQIAPEYIYE